MFSISCLPTVHCPKAASDIFKREINSWCPLDENPPRVAHTSELTAWYGRRKKVKSLSRVRLLRPHGLQACQPPPSTGFSRQGYWSGLPFPSPGDLPDLGIKPGLLHYRQLLYHLSYWLAPIILFYNIVNEYVKQSDRDQKKNQGSRTEIVAAKLLED